MAGQEKKFLKLVSSDETAAPMASSRYSKSFPENYVAPWLRACRRLSYAGYGDPLVAAYERCSAACASLIGADAAIDMADTVSAVAIKAGRDAATRLCEAAVLAANRLETTQLFLSWLGLMQRLAALAPESVGIVLDRTDSLLGSLRVSGLEAWILAGVRASGGDAERRRAFFSLEDPEAERWLSREAGDVTFTDVERRMKAFLTAMFGIGVPLLEVAATLPPHQRRRPSFGAGMIRLPTTFPGYRGLQAEEIFRAAIAHVGAHLRYSGTRFDVGGLKPVQVAVVSLIEDARIETLAMRDFPGLRRLWLPFHIAQSSGALTAPSLFARLSRALIDPDFSDIDGWVRKGRDLFSAHLHELENPAISRHVGNLLGNDLGQMRVQFNAKSYVVEPPYRDDNMGLWDFGEEDRSDPDWQVEADLYRPREPKEDDLDPPETDREEPDDSEEPDHVSPISVQDEEAGIPIARYPEYDYVAACERSDWTTLVEYDPPIGDPHGIDLILERRSVEANRISALIRAARVSRARRMKRQAEGETLDLDACLEAMVDLRAGDTPDPRVYQMMQRRDRDLSVLVLLDVSQSTADRLQGRFDTVLDMEREATVMLAHAMSELNDPYAIDAFCSNGRDDVHYMKVKPFDVSFDVAAKSKLAGIAAGFSTRMGAALRHAGRGLATQNTYRRLLLVLTDGEPSDVDCPDQMYLIEDARRAVHGLSHSGIDVFCIALGAANDDVLQRVFGRHNVVKIDNISRLPEKLPILYLRLTA